MKRITDTLQVDLGIFDSITMNSLRTRNISDKNLYRKSTHAFYVQ